MTDFSALLKQATNVHDSASWTGRFAKGMDEVTLYFHPLTPADTHKISKRHPKWEETGDIRAVAYTISIKALKEDGELAFSALDLPFLEMLPVTKINEIAEPMWQVSAKSESIEDRVGN